VLVHQFLFVVLAGTGSSWRAGMATLVHFESKALQEAPVTLRVMTDMGSPYAMGMPMRARNGCVSACCAAVAPGVGMRRLRSG